jgi:competence CoiA-like predicted nuclease
MIWAISNQERIKAEPNKTALCDICGKQLIPKCGSIKVWHWAHRSNNNCDAWSEHETRWHIDWKNEFPKEQQEIVIEKEVKIDLLDGHKRNMGFELHKQKHRADIKINNLIIELQNSSISSEEIIERENYYGHLIWLLNGATIGRGIEIRERKGVITFRWKFPPKSWWYSNKPKFIDFSQKLSTLLLEYEAFQQGKRTGQNVSYQVDNAHWENDSIDTTHSEKEAARKRFNLLLERPILLIKKIYAKCPCGGWGILLTKEDFLKEVKNGN